MQNIKAEKMAMNEKHDRLDNFITKFVALNAEHELHLNLERKKLVEDFDNREFLIQAKIAENLQ